MVGLLGFFLYLKYESFTLPNAKDERGKINIQSKAN